MNIENRIKQIRESKRIKQIEVANALNMDYSQYAKLEKRGSKLSLEQIEAIANALGVSVAELIGISVSDNLDSSEEISKLLKENGELKEKGDVLDNIQSSYLEIFQEHIEILKNEILNEGENENLSLIDINTEEKQLKHLSFMLFLKKMEWYEIAFNLKIIADNKIISLWERFKYINPLCFTLDDIEKYKKLITKVDNSEDIIITEMINERGKNLKYEYLNGEIAEMKKLYESYSSTKIGGMKTKIVPQIISSKNEMYNKLITEIEQQQEQLHPTNVPFSPLLRADDKKDIIDGLYKKLIESMKNP